MPPTPLSCGNLIAWLDQHCARLLAHPLTTKILALTDALGNLVRFVLLPGQRYNTVGVAPLIDGVAFHGLIADKAFDANWIIAELNERGAKIVSS